MRAQSQYLLCEKILMTLNRLQTFIKFMATCMIYATLETIFDVKFDVLNKILYIL